VGADISELAFKHLSIKEFSCSGQGVSIFWKRWGNCFDLRDQWICAGEAAASWRFPAHSNRQQNGEAPANRK